MGISIALVGLVCCIRRRGLALDVDSTVVRALFITLAGLAITVAWMVSWMVVELAIYDWRDPAWRSRVYDLLSRANLEVAIEEDRTG